jgi:hypothetical protein
MERNKNPKGNAKHGKIENVAGSVWLSMNRLNQTEPATFSILLCWTFFRDSVFLYFIWLILFMDVTDLQIVFIINQFFKRLGTVDQNTSNLISRKEQFLKTELVPGWSIFTQSRGKFVHFVRIIT